VVVGLDDAGQLPAATVAAQPETARVRHGGVVQPHVRELCRVRPTHADFQSVNDNHHGAIHQTHILDCQRVRVRRDLVCHHT